MPSHAFYKTDAELSGTNGSTKRSTHNARLVHGMNPEHSLFDGPLRLPQQRKTLRHNLQNRRGQSQSKPAGYARTLRTAPQQAVLHTLRRSSRKPRRRRAAQRSTPVLGESAAVHGQNRRRRRNPRCRTAVQNGPPASVSQEAEETP